MTRPGSQRSRRAVKCLKCRKSAVEMGTKVQDSDENALNAGKIQEEDRPELPEAPPCCTIRVKKERKCALKTQKGAEEWPLKPGPQVLKQSQRPEKDRTRRKKWVVKKDNRAAMEVQLGGSSKKIAHKHQLLSCFLFVSHLLVWSCQASA